MWIQPSEILHGIDLSAVRGNQTDADIAELVATAREYGCGLVTILPAQTALTRRLLGGTHLPKLGGNVGFPSGGQTPAVKAAEARELVALGCDELDMVVNLSALLSGRLKDVVEDIAGVVSVAQGRPIKVILECANLNEGQMRSGCEAAIEAGAAFVKTSTGWNPDGATPEMVAFLKGCVGERIGVKASGGIRSLEQLIVLYRCGARRFGIGLHSGLPILQALAALNEEKIPIDL